MRCHLFSFADSGSQEALHKLRVEIKKINAFTKFFHACTGKVIPPTHLRAIKKIFHYAGVIREANISLLMMKQYHIIHAAFRAKETHILRQKSAKFSARVARYDKRIRKADKALQKTLQPVKNSDIKHWFTRQLKIVAGTVAATSVNHLHQARKKIKTLIYVHGILPRRLVTALALNIDYLDQLQDDIGKWHDTTVAADLLISRKIPGKAVIKKLREEQGKTATTVHATADNFWDKIYQDQFSKPIIYTK